MSVLEWMGAIIGGAAALFLFVVLFFHAWGMTMEQARTARWQLCLAIGTMLVLETISGFLPERSRWWLAGMLVWIIYGSALLVTGMMLVVGMSLLTRAGFRRIGLEISVIAIMGLWWWRLDALLHDILRC